MPALIVRIREASDIALLVMRGDAVDPTILRADAARFQREGCHWSAGGDSDGRRLRSHLN